MQFAHSSVPKKNSELGEDTTEACGLHFCPMEEAVTAFQRETAGKTLFVSDGRSFPALAFAAMRPRSLSVVLEGRDALPLFTMPDVGAVFAAGGEETLVAARFFAETRRIPCAVAPANAALHGVFSAKGEVIADGERTLAPLTAAKIFCDVGFLRASLAEGLAWVALARLARFEAHALAVFSAEQPSLPPAELSTVNAEGIVRANAALRQSEEAGAWQGEGAKLARLYAVSDARRAAAELTALYHAFFKCGRPRKYAVADYSARARHAGRPYSEAAIPSPELYARRALMLERRRADLLRELELVIRKNSAEMSSVCAFSRPVAYYTGASEALLYLPEHCPEGLCAVIRDFGLLERT